jgi:hypothetical protein
MPENSLLLMFSLLTSFPTTLYPFSILLHVFEKTHVPFYNRKMSSVVGGGKRSILCYCCVGVASSKQDSERQYEAYGFHCKVFPWPHLLTLKLPIDGGLANSTIRPTRNNPPNDDATTVFVTSSSLQTTSLIWSSRNTPEKSLLLLLYLSYTWFPLTSYPSIIL